MKKIIALVLALAMALSLVACGSSSKDKPAAAQSSTEAGSTTELNPADPLRIWAWDESFNVPALQDAIELYEQKNGLEEGSVVIDYMTSGDVYTALTTAATSGDYSQLPDISLIEDHRFPLYIQSYPDLFEGLADSGIDFSQFADWKTSYSTINGENYAVPLDTGCVVASYRTDILADAGYSIEDLTDITWDEFCTIGSDIYAKTGKHLLSGSLSTDSNDPLAYILQSAGGSMFDENGNANLSMDNAELIAAMETMKKLVDSKTMEIVSSWDEWVATFATKETAIGVINGCWILATMESGNETQEGSWAMTQMPALAGVDSATHFSNNGGSSWAVLGTSSKIELAKDFLASTFASEADAESLYSDILNDSAMVCTYKPALEADIYNGTLSKFGDQKIYADIAAWTDHVPTQADSPYYFEALDVMAAAQQKYIDGADLESVMQEAASNFAAQVG